MKPSFAPAQNHARRNMTLALLALLALTFAFFASAGSADAAKKKRIVALTPFAANTMAELGVAPVAVGQTLGGDRRLAPVLRKAKVLTLSHPNGPNLEELAKLRPDIVLTSPTWKKGTSAMRQLGIKVKTVEPLNLGQVYKQTKMIAKLVGRKAKGNKRVQRMRKSIAKETKNYKARPTVMLILGVGRTPYTFLGNSWGGQIIKAAGGNLMTGGASADGGFARISDEVVIAEDPDVIIGVPHGNTKDIPGLIEYMKTNPAWSNTSAATNDRVYVSTDNSLLQAGTDVAKVIRTVRSQYLKNR